ncbi:MAG: PH domain-containing protein [Elusimicrobia bacterium]|nr:PH domain-containing protein [Elusimicrobiota bacterium]
MTPEKLLWEGRPSFWTQWPSLLIADLALILASTLWWTGYREWAPWALALSVPFYLLAAGRRSRVLYRITDQRISIQTGSISRRVEEVAASDIRNITLTQTFIERLVGIGTVGVSTAAGESVELVLRDVPGASAVKEAVRVARLSAPKAPPPAVPND